MPMWSTKDVNTIKTTGARASLRWDAADNVNATLNVIFQDVEADGHGDITRGAGDSIRCASKTRASTTSGISWADGQRRLAVRRPGGVRLVFRSGFPLRGGCHRLRVRVQPERDRVRLADLRFRRRPARLRNEPREDAHHHVSKRACLRGPIRAAAGAWIVGAFYSEEGGKTAFDSFVRGYENTPSFEYFDAYEQALTGNPLAPTERWFLGRYDTELDQKAVFGELTFDVTENFKITAGGRWFDYDRKFGQVQEQPEGFSGFSRLDGNQKNSEDGTVKKLNFTYKLDSDRLIYATYSEGFRVGGSNPLKPASALPREYKSDELKNYELGIKSEWLDHRLRLNMSALLHEVGQFRGTGRGSAAGGLPAGLRQSADALRSRASRPSSR